MNWSLRLSICTGSAITTTEMVFTFGQTILLVYQYLTIFTLALTAHTEFTENSKYSYLKLWGFHLKYFATRIKGQKYFNSWWNQFILIQFQYIFISEPYKHWWKRKRVSVDLGAEHNGNRESGSVSHWTSQLINNKYLLAQPACHVRICQISHRIGCENSENQQDLR